MKNQKKNISVSSTWNPVLEKKVTAVLTDCGRIWTKDDDVDGIIKYFYFEQKGGNAKTLHYLIAKKYAGISIDRINIWLKNSHFHSVRHP